MHKTATLASLGDFGTMWFCLTFTIRPLPAPISSLRTSLLGELRRMHLALAAMRATTATIIITITNIINIIIIIIGSVIIHY